MPLPVGSIQLSTSLHQPSSPSARCSSARASMTRMSTLCQLVRAFIRSGRLSGNLIPPSRRPSNGWGRGDLPPLCEQLPIITMEIPQKLKEYIDNNRGSLPPITDPDEPLQIDSLGLIRLVAFLESDLGYRVEDEELIAENFATLRRLGELLATKTPTAPTAEAKASAQEGIPTFSAKRET